MEMSQQPEARQSQLPLAGVGVLVTRPAHQADNLCALIEAAGGRAVRFPTLEITDPPDSDAARAALSRLADYDVAIFISANAVDKAVALRAAPEWPPRPPRVAVGVGTARALERHGLPVAWVPPPPYDSAALLAAPALQQVDGQRIVIIRGVGGRELLGETLRARGAHVDYVEVYQRVRPCVETRDILKAWTAGAIDVVTATSAEALYNLVVMMGAAGRAPLLAAPLVVVSTRMIQHALELGFAQPPRVAEAASDEALVAAVIAWRRATTVGEPE